MKKIIAIIVISVLSLAMIGCSCASCGCGGGQNVPSAKGEVSIAYDKAEIRDLLSYYQANQGYVVTFVPLEESTDFAKLSETRRDVPFFTSTNPAPVMRTETRRTGSRVAL